MFNLSKKHVCRDCGETKAPYLRRKGSLILEIFLWFFFIIPGVFYTIYRFANIIKYCPKCKSENVVSKDSPIGKKLMMELSKS